MKEERREVLGEPLWVSAALGINAHGSVAAACLPACLPTRSARRRRAAAQQHNSTAKWLPGSLAGQGGGTGGDSGVEAETNDPAAK